jgi:hypothetical protein
MAEVTLATLAAQLQAVLEGMAGAEQKLDGPRGAIEGMTGQH